MNKDRTRTFNGTYVTADKKEYHLKVRVFKRLGAFGLALFLVHTAIAMSNESKDADKNLSASFSTETFSEDKELIESIIKHNPRILKDVTETTYTILEGDTLSNIAVAHGTSVNRICYLNDIKDSDIIYTGGTLKVENVTDKEAEDKAIAALESYFYDYVFKSPVAEIAASKDESKANQAMYYRSLIYGNPPSEADIDPSSLFGQYVRFYINFHEGRETHTIEEKKDYIAKLNDLSQEAEHSLNLGGAANVIVPYSEYLSYLEKGTTKDMTTQMIN